MPSGFRSERPALSRNLPEPAPIELCGRQVTLRTSIGIRTSDIGFADPQELLRDADIAMFEAKRRPGENVVIFDVAMHLRVPSRLNREAELRHALKDTKRSEFVVHYQPIISVRTGALRGLEALVRWQHPEEGLLGPNGFVPLAEETGLIVPLTYRILEQACAEVGSWVREHVDLDYPLQLNVNVSPHQLLDPQLQSRVRRLLQELPAGVELSFEITERAPVENSRPVLEMMQELRKLGVNFSIDDFGTGHSSLAYLQRLPVDTLKIDRAFVDHLVDDRNSRAIVEAILHMARTLGLEAIAEGVETADQLQALFDLGCAFAQGYLIAKPMPLGEFQLESVHFVDHRKADLAVPLRQAFAWVTGAAAPRQRPDPPAGTRPSGSVFS